MLNSSIYNHKIQYETILDRLKCMMFLSQLDYISRLYMYVKNKLFLFQCLMMLNAFQYP